MDKLAIKCGEYVSKLSFPQGGSLSAGCRTGADIQLGEPTDDGPLFVTLVNLGGGKVHVADLGMGAVLVNSAPVANQAYGTPIILTLSDLGVDLHLAVESELPAVSVLPPAPTQSDALPPVVPSSGLQSEVPPATPRLPAKSDSAPRRQKAIVFSVVGVVLLAMVAGAIVFFHRPASKGTSSAHEAGASTAASKATPVSATEPAPVKAAANSVKATPTNPAETLLAEGKKLEGDNQLVQAVEKFKGAADLGSAEAWNVLGILTMQGGDSKAPEAFGYFSKAADGGYPRGIYNLGLCYRDGVGTASDPSKAVGLFQKASDLGIPEAMVALAAAYETGTGADADKSFQWYQKAADAGNLDATVALGKAYAEGNGVARDETKAATLFEQAAAKDRADAINNLGVLYASGRGVVKDPAKAKSCYAKAAELGNADARDNLKTLERESAQKRTPPEPATGSQAPAMPLSPVAETRAVSPVAPSSSAERKSDSSEQITDSRVISFPDALEKADAGDAYAQAVVSIYYGLGYKTEKDVGKSAGYAAKSADQEDPLGIYQYGVLISAGDGVMKDPAKGKDMKIKALEGLNRMTNDPYALSALASMALRGEGVSKDIKNAAKLYRKAADLGYAPAQILYAAMLSKGVGVSLDTEAAKTYAKKAQQQNYTP